jgi:hypothetical protein
MSRSDADVRTLRYGALVGLLAVGSLALSGVQRLGAGDAGPVPLLAAAAVQPIGEAEDEDPDASTSDGVGSDAPELAAPPAVQGIPTADGRAIVATGTSSAGNEEGPLLRFTVEVESELAIGLDEVVAAVEAALYDERSWARDVRFERVDDPALATVRVLVAAPATVDAMCGRVGLRTLGRYSCWTGRFTALNADRWVNGAADFDDLELYRRYLVNHEVGHALGYRHARCASVGTLAPIMVQQTIGTGGCVANGWPYP